MSLVIELSAEMQAALAAKAETQGISTEQYVRQMVERDLQAPIPPRSPLAARIREIWADMPEDVRSKLPADGASQHDHYIYGLPKRTV